MIKLSVYFTKSRFKINILEGYHPSSTLTYRAGQYGGIGRQYPWGEYLILFPNFAFWKSFLFFPAQGRVYLFLSLCSVLLRIAVCTPIF